MQNDVAGRDGSALTAELKANEEWVRAWFAARYQSSDVFLDGPECLTIEAACELVLAYAASRLAAERGRCATLCRDMMPAEGVIRRTLLDLEAAILGSQTAECRNLPDEQRAALALMLHHFGSDPRTECLRVLAEPTAKEKQR